MTTKTTTEPIHQFACAINRAGRVKAFVQPGNVLRIVARSTAQARVEMARAEHITGIAETEAARDIFQVRIIGTTQVDTYPTQTDPMRKGINPRTGAYVELPAELAERVAQAG